MLDWNLCPVVERAPGKVSGEWLFKSTRVPVRALFENLEDGARVDDFLEWFPGVTRAQVEAALRHAEQSLALRMRILFDQRTAVPLRNALVEATTDRDRYAPLSEADRRSPDAIARRAAER